MTSFQFAVLFFCTLCFGSIIGAYFTTAEYRIQNGLPLITRECYCPSCSHVLTAVHQIPLVGFFLLRGRCHYCHAPIPVRYPLIEGGFLAGYGLSFLLLFRHPVLLSALWLSALWLLLIFRCRRRHHGLFKGLLIFSAYHLVYGLLLFAILS